VSRSRHLRPITFESRQLLGPFGPLVVPSGTTLASPILNFSGMNALSVKCHISGFAGGDALTIRLNTVDPESATGAAVPASLGTKDLIVVAGNGDLASMLNLRSYYSSLIPSTQFSRPSGDKDNSAAVKWVNEVGSTVNVYQSINEVVPNDTNYARHPRTIATITYNMSTVIDPGTDIGLIYRIRARIVGLLNGNDHLLVNLNQNGTTVFTSNNMPAQAGFWTPNDAQLSNAFTTYEHVLSAAEAANITDYSKLNTGNSYYTGFDGSTFVDVSWIELQVPAAGGGSGAPGVGMLPFYLNFLEFVNTGATSVTIDSMIAELTYA